MAGILNTGNNVSKTLTNTEAETLHGILKLMRNKEQPRFVSKFIERLAGEGNYAEEGGKVEHDEMLRRLIVDMTEEAMPEGQAAHGVLCARKLRVISEKEFEALEAYLSLLRSQTWLECFIGVEVLLFNQGYRRTPKEVLSALMEEMENFKWDQKTTRSMLRDFPELFRDELTKTSAGVQGVGA